MLASSRSATGFRPPVSHSGIAPASVSVVQCL